MGLTGIEVEEDYEWVARAATVSGLAIDWHIGFVKGFDNYVSKLPNNEVSDYANGHQMGQDLHKWVLREGIPHNCSRYFAVG